MRRLWFKKEMKDAILRGDKRATTRNHKLKVRGLYRAVSGQRFKAEPFAILKITSRREIEHLAKHCMAHFPQEGFNSGQEMIDFIRANLPNYIENYEQAALYYHTFRVIST